MYETIPREVDHIDQHAEEFRPNENKITLADGTELHYNYLVLALGVKYNYDAVPGMQDALFDPTHPVVSIFDFRNAMKAADHIREFQGGNAVFTQPTTPVKCAPQKILYLADYYWDRNRIRN